MSNNPVFIDNYHFELEKYLGKISENPYIGELRENLIDEQINNIKLFSSDACFKLLPHDLLSEIYEKCTNNYILKIFIKSLDLNGKSIDKNISKIQSKINEFDFKLTNLETLKPPSNIRISTMTICANMGTNIDTSKIYKYFNPPEISEYLINISSLKKTKPKYISDFIGIVGCKADDLPPKGTFNKKKNC